MRVDKKNKSKKDESSKVKNKALETVGLKIKSPQEEIKEFKENTKSTKGTIKNAWKIASKVPEPVSALVVFLIMLVIPFLLVVTMVIGIVLMGGGLIGAIGILDPDMVYEAPKEDTNNGVNNRNFYGNIPEAARGKLLLSWNTGYMTRGQIGVVDEKVGKVGHQGYDLQPVGRKIGADDLGLYPMAPGVVHVVSDMNSGKLPKSYGHAILIKHVLGGKNFYVLYAHLNSIFVKEGQQVDYFTKVGKMGCTGNSDGSWVDPDYGCKGIHLHMELRSDKYETVGMSNASLLRWDGYINCGDKEIVAGFGVNIDFCVDYRTKVLGEDQYGKSP